MGSGSGARSRAAAARRRKGSDPWAGGVRPGRSSDSGGPGRHDCRADACPSPDTGPGDYRADACPSPDAGPGGDCRAGTQPSPGAGGCRADIRSRACTGG
jgi:hypothetical protein